MYVMFRKHEIKNVKKDKTKEKLAKNAKNYKQKEERFDTFWKRHNCGWTSLMVFFVLV